MHPRRVALLCAVCGTENRPGSKFCDNCGTPLAFSCRSCGQPNRSDARFCAECGAPLRSEVPHQADLTAPRTSAPAASERRIVSVLFSDLVGFTTFAEDRDPEAVRDLLTRYFDTATEVVQRHGGTVEKFIGDAVMAVWGTPVAHEDDAERAVRAALEIVDAVRALQPDLQARAGVLTGDAAVTLNAHNQGMVAGDLVNTAARLQGVAEPGTVLVGEATMRAAERSIVFERIGDRSLKGKTAPVPAWQALRVVAARGGQGRADALEPPFVGRDEELRQLKEVLHATGRERRPRLVSITGPGGIGKSRLVWELEKYVDGVAEDVYWHRGRSPSYGEGITFWALGEMVRRRAQLSEDADDETTRRRIAEMLDEFSVDASERDRIGLALLTLLGLEEAPTAGRDALFPAWRLFFERIAERGTTILVFEDLQWADTGLLDFIDHLLDWTRSLPLLVVTLARPELFDRRPEFGGGRRHLTAMPLEPLSDAAVREMLNGLVPGLPEDALAAIVGRAEGVPLYAVETVRGLLADGRLERRGDVYAPVGDLSTMRVPDSLRSLIASRLDALSPADRSLVQDAAVLGQVFSIDALQAVTGLTHHEADAQLQGLVRRELMDIERDTASPEHGQYKFVQSLIREVAYGTLSRRDRRARHLAVARHYEAVGDDELAGALASHYLAAHEASEPGEEADAVATQARIALAAAADRAASLGAHEQAIAYLEQALSITTTPSERAPLLDRAARSAATASRDAVRFATEAIEAYRAVGDQVAAAAARARLGKVLIDESEIQQATEVLEAALPEAEATGDEPVLATTLAYLARAHMRAARSTRAVELADRALTIAERINLDPIVAEAFVNKGAALNILGRRREAVALQRAGLEIAHRIGDINLGIRTRNNLAGSLIADDPLGAREMYLQARELARQVGDRGMYNWLAGLAAITTMSMGVDLDDDIAILREALDGATLRVDRLRLRLILGLLEGHRGERLDELRSDVAELVADSSDPELLFHLHMARAVAAHMSADYGTACREAMAAAELSPQNPEVPLGVALRNAVAAHDRDGVTTAAAGILALPSSGELDRSLRLSAEGAIAALKGHVPEALAAYSDARSIALKFEQRFEAAVLAVSAAHLLGDQAEVRAWAEEARLTFAGMRARPWLEELDAALSAAAPETTARPTRDAQSEVPTAG